MKRLPAVLPLPMFALACYVSRDLGVVEIDAGNADSPETTDRPPPGCEDPDTVVSEIDLTRRIAFDAVVGGIRKLFTVRPNGCNSRQLTFGSTSDVEPVFSPAGFQLAFTSTKDSGPPQIHLLELQSLAVLPLTHRSEGADQPAWSPDGSLIAFHSGKSVYLIAPDGTGERALATGHDGRSYQRPTFTRDGQSVLMDDGRQIDVVSLDGRNTRTLVPAGAENESQYGASVSPDGSTVALNALCEKSTGSLPPSPTVVIVMVPIDGVTDVACHAGHRLTPEIDSWAIGPAWGPPDVIAYERGLAGQSDIALIRVSDRASFNLTKSRAKEANPAWSPLVVVP